MYVRILDTLSLYMTLWTDEVIVVMGGSGKVRGESGRVRGGSGRVKVKGGMWCE